MTNKRIRLLFIPRETYPTHRVRISALFFQEMFSRKHPIDLVMQAKDVTVKPGWHSFNGRQIYVGRTDTGKRFWNRLNRHLLALRHDLWSLRLINKRSYDVVKVSDKFLIAAVALIVAHLRGVKFVFWLSFPVPEAQLLRARERTARYPALAYLRGVSSWILLYKWILPRSDYILVQSEQMKLDICKHGANPSKVTPIVSGVDLKDFENRKKYLKTGSSENPEITIGYLGTLGSDRKLEVLIDALWHLKTNQTRIKLLLVGDGDRPDERTKLVTRAQELGVKDQIEITGFLPYKEALSRFLSTDIAISPIFPSPILNPGSPTKLVEYLALGIPVVANKHPEQKLILKESKAGICVPWGARYFAKGIAKLIQLTPEQRFEMGQNGRSWVENNRTYARIADTLESAYAKII